MLNNLTAVNGQAITQSDSTVYNPPIVMVMLFEANVTLAMVNEWGETVTFTVPTVGNGASLPVVIPGRWRQILSTGTTAADANIFGFRLSKRTPADGT